MKSRSLLLGFAFLLSFSSANAAGTRAECATPSDASFEKVEKTAADISDVTKIVGNYSSRVFRQSCRLNAPSGFLGESICSATYVGGTRLITAAHCDLSQKETTVSCFCGVNSYGADVFTTSKITSAKSNPSYAGTESPKQGYDIQVAHMEKAPICPLPFAPKIAPALLPKTLEEAKALLKLGNCYFSGYGRDNTQTAGTRHVVESPQNYTFMKTNGTELVQHLGTKMILDTYQYKRTALTAKTKEALKLQKELNDISQSAAKDPNANSGFDHGDSGGSLICIGADKKEYLIGVPVRALQVSTLINDTAVWQWLKATP